MEVTERKVQEIGKSFLITLPKQWTKLFKIEKGSKIKILVSEQGNLVIAPEFIEKEEKKESTILYDRNLNRKFFREYFNGNEKITIKNKLTEKERKELHEFLKLFMNVQIIEETPEKIAVKSFRIEELSMEECIKRMYFISLNMFDNYSQESRDTMTRFYYMLVMQVRRFLSEGKFTSEQIPIIRAMDIRMAAEKIQRTAELLEKTKADKKTKDYYSRACLAFISNDFEKASVLWSEADFFDKKNQIARYAKDISMLVR